MDCRAEWQQGSSPLAEDYDVAPATNRKLGHNGIMAHDLVELLKVAEAAEHAAGARHRVRPRRQHLHIHPVELRRTGAASALTGRLADIKTKSIKMIRITLKENIFVG